MLQLIRERVDSYDQDRVESNNVNTNISGSTSSQPRKPKDIASLKQPLLGSPQRKIPAWELDSVEATSQSLRALAFRNSYQQLLAFLKDENGSNTFPALEDFGNVSFDPVDMLQRPLC
jgi:hypothetical protein